ncbi:hypothetical protein HUK80_00170 [Flavobacterium sp. MAH-1]|uniref:Uncharacterized protein n=1 Tax=Flavobacterium agri TaxID=2743471 RepID=A0A7Y9C3X5_9FLAO|nr:hypothetical protein [Flavobacterium agri]NUY79291.1 hypothetical protein [Flavobacterium agri]NYA69315.1 hypothetical protein [Flavobacterium agri]
MTNIFLSGITGSAVLLLLFFFLVLTTVTSLLTLLLLENIPATKRFLDRQKSNGWPKLQLTYLGVFFLGTSLLVLLLTIFESVNDGKGIL